MRTEYAQEAYTAYRTETVPETRTRNVTTYKTIHEQETRTRCVTKYEKHCEPRTTCKQVWHSVPVTVMKTRTVDKGHWECQCVEAGPSLCDRLKAMCGKKDDCCCECPRYETKKVWIPCKVCEEYPCTTYEKKCEIVHNTEMVTVCHPVTHQETYTVCVPKCIPETHCETYTVNTCRSVPYTAYRCVAKCVPHCETVTCTRMVCRTKTIEVPVETCASSCDCTPSCGCEEACCAESCKKKHGLFGRLFGGQ